MSRSVSIIGLGETKFGKLEGATLRSLINEAGNAAIRDAGIDKKDIQALYFGNYNGSFLCGQSHTGPLAAEELQLESTIPTVRTEGACASGSLALRMAIGAICSGMYDVVLVGGAEKMTHRNTADVTEAIASAMDYELEASIGQTFPGCFAQIANRYFYEYRNVKREMGICAMNAHRNALLNPHAQMGKDIPLEKILAADMIADPLSIYDCSLVSDGAVFVVFAASEIAERYQPKQRIVDIIGSGHAGDALLVAAKKSLTSFVATKAAASQAYSQANLRPSDIDFAEVHDCFTITQIINTEDLGFFEHGKGADAVNEGITARDGRKPINVSGGLKAKGHPIGATGLAQIYEVATQLRGEGGPRQLKKANIGLTHNLGGAAATCLVHILRGRG